MHGTASARARSGAARVEAGASAGEAGADVRVGSDGTRPGFTVVEVLALPHTLPGEQQVRMAGEQLLREVTPEGMSLALGLHLCFPEQYKSMSAARKALRRGEILSETMAELSTSVRVRGGEALLVQRRSQPGLYPQGEKPFDLDVLFEDDHMAVVVKPPGVMTHRHRLSGQSGTVKSGLAYVLAPTRADDALFRPAPCHRLDQGTGGLLVAAKTRRAVAAISAQFAERRVSKEYAAVVAGRLEGEHTVAAPLSGASRTHSPRIAPPRPRAPATARLTLAGACAGVAAETHVAGRGGVRSLKYGWVSEVACRPVTGRKHQIRRHLLSLGHPIVGDARYTGASCGRPEWTPDDCGAPRAPRTAPRAPRPAPRAPRPAPAACQPARGAGAPAGLRRGRAAGAGAGAGLLLWATRLELDHPLDQRRLVFVRTPPAAFCSPCRRVLGGAPGIRTWCEASCGGARGRRSRRRRKGLRASCGVRASATASSTQMAPSSTQASRVSDSGGRQRPVVGGDVGGAACSVRWERERRRGAGGRAGGRGLSERQIRLMTNSRKPQSEKLATGGGRGTQLSTARLVKNKNLEGGTRQNRTCPSRGSGGAAAPHPDLSTRRSFSGQQRLASSGLS
jgi:23S rRNA-/tRNA-specific pseudouridylate synthase